MTIMAPNILIRSVPGDVHQTLTRRASDAGQSLQEYLLEMLREVTSRPTMQEIVSWPEREGPGSEGPGSDHPRNRRGNSCPEAAVSAGIVLDASVVVEGLAGEGRATVWAREMMATAGPLAPELLYVEVAQSLKRHETLGKGLEQAFQDVVRLPVTHILFST